MSSASETTDISLVSVGQGVSNGVNITATVVSRVDSVARVPSPRIKRTNLGLNLPILHQLIGGEVTTSLSTERSSAQSFSGAICGTQVGVIGALVRFEGDVTTTLVGSIHCSCTGGCTVEAWDVERWVGKLVAIGASDHDVEISSILSLVG